MQRYFVKNRDKDNFKLNDDDSYHITKVMRMNFSDKIEIVNDGNTYICEIIELSKNVVARIIERIEESNELSNEIVLVQSLVKETKMDLILQKNTELGINKFIPFIAERSVVKLNKDDYKKVLRWNRIVKEASEQSKRNIIPEVTEIKNIDEICESRDFDLKILCSVNEKSKTLKKVLQNSKKSDTMIIVVGPEGGFSEKEEAKFILNGFIPTSLGNSVLRTETAGIFVISSIRYNNMG